jgi:predicted ArsR family transcriptional regulator
MYRSIIEFLRNNGERLEADIAKELHLPMTLVQSHLSQLSSTGEVICCRLTRYFDGTKIEGTSWRLALARSGRPMQPLTSATPKR